MENSWEFLRQRNFTGGESLATLPEMVQRSQLIRCMDTILSPEGELTAAWQLDTPLFLNVPGGIVIAPIPGSNLLTVFAASGNNIITFTVDPSSATPYDFAAASGYPGYATRAQANAVNIVGITHGTPYHGKNYCCAATIISAFAGTLTGGPSTIAYGTVAFNSVHQLGTAITNHTAAPITLTNASISGAGAAYYGQSGSFPQVVAPGGSYTIPTTFHPLSAGESDAILSVTCAAGRLDIPMTGSATAALLLSPSSIIAPYSDIGTNSTIGATLYNLNGLSPQVISGVTVTGPFTVLTTFPKTIPAGGALALSLQFTPTAAGDTSGTVTATGSDGTCSANISGTALAPRNLWPNYGLNYDFGSVYHTVNQGPTKNISFSNLNQIANITITSIVLGGNNPGCFVIARLNSNNSEIPMGLPSSIQPNQNIALRIYFNPNGTSGTISATISIVTDFGTMTFTINGYGS